MEFRRVLFRSDIAEKAGVAVDSWSTGCAFGDYDGDGWLDLFVAGYVSLDLANPPPSAVDSPQPASTSARAATGDQRQAVGMGATYSPGAAACMYRGERVICG